MRGDTEERTRDCVAPGHKAQQPGSPDTGTERLGPPKLPSHHLWVRLVELREYGKHPSHCDVQSL